MDPYGLHGDDGPTHTEEYECLEDGGWLKRGNVVRVDPWEFGHPEFPQLHAARYDNGEHWSSPYYLLVRLVLSEEARKREQAQKYPGAPDLERTPIVLVRRK